MVRVACLQKDFETLRIKCKVIANIFHFYFNKKSDSVPETYHSTLEDLEIAEAIAENARQMEWESERIGILLKRVRERFLNPIKDEVFYVKCFMVRCSFGVVLTIIFDRNQIVFL